MRLKTFRAQTMADALSQVKRDLGKDAVILHTRMFKVGAFFGFGGRPMVEITASDDVRVRERQLSARRARRGEAAIAGAGAGAGGGGGAGAPGGAGGVSVELSAAARAPAAAPHRAAARAYGGPEAAVPRGASGASRATGPGAGTPEPPEANGVPAGREVARAAIDHPVPPGEGEPAMAAELRAIRRMVGQVLQTSARAGTGAAAAGRMPEPLLKHYLRLIENEVAQEVADEITGAIRDELTPAELQDDGVVRTAVLRHLESLIPVADGEAGGFTGAERPADGRPLTIALIGPTGVGKTTTIAKLAAAYRLRHRKRVGLITSDTYRIAAVDQLRTYANIIGVPLRVAGDPAEMAAACAELADADVLLIDTAGRSPSDAHRLGELRAFLTAARPHQTHLVLASNAGERSLDRTVERFAPLGPNLVIFTKLDEAANLGVLVNISRRINAKLSYVTGGQEVPDDIEPGRADRLARLVLDGKDPA